MAGAFALLVFLLQTPLLADAVSRHPSPISPYLISEDK
jgi:hypothetical protein